MTISASQNRCISYGKQHILEMDHFGVIFTIKHGIHGIMRNVVKYD